MNEGIFAVEICVIPEVLMNRFLLTFAGIFRIPAFGMASVEIASGDKRYNCRYSGPPNPLPHNGYDLVQVSEQSWEHETLIRDPLQLHCKYSPGGGGRSGMSRPLSQILTCSTEKITY